jgi:hypothetical protein
MPTLTRAPAQQYSNTLNPNGPGPWQWYEKTYAATGAQEWINIPDVGAASITLSGSGAWVATVEATDSPPDVIAAGNAVVVAWANGTQTATTSASVLTGATAVRCNITTLGTNVKLTVRV